MSPNVPLLYFRQKKFTIARAEKLVAAAFDLRLYKPRDTSKEVEVGKLVVYECLHMFSCIIL